MLQKKNSHALHTTPTRILARSAQSSHDDNDEPDAAPFDFSFEDTRDEMPLDEKALRKEIWASSPERR